MREAKGVKEVREAEEKGRRKADASPARKRAGSA
jgi:hypothetical protein